MAVYQVWAEEVVTYYAEVEADNAVEARKIAESGVVEWGHPVDGEEFRVVEVGEL
jgi:hypothetical protein